LPKQKKRKEIDKMLKSIIIERPDVGEGMFQVVIIETDYEEEVEVEPLMSTLGMGRLIEELFGNGSGEELLDYTINHGLTYEEASTVVELLKKVW
jgi:hypothetical protein